MNDEMLLLQTYAVCRQGGDDHQTALKNAKEVISAMKNINTPA